MLRSIICASVGLPTSLNNKLLIYIKYCNLQSTCPPTQINNNATPSDLSDDSIIFSTIANLVGEDSFQYTICDESGNCQTENVSVTITSLSVVNVFEDTPHQTLSEYNFFEGNLP